MATASECDRSCRDTWAESDWEMVQFLSAWWYPFVWPKMMIPNHPCIPTSDTKTDKYKGYPSGSDSVETEKKKWCNCHQLGDTHSSEYNTRLLLVSKLPTNTRWNPFFWNDIQSTLCSTNTQVNLLILTTLVKVLEPEKKKSWGCQQFCVKLTYSKWSPFPQIYR